MTSTPSTRPSAAPTTAPSGLTLTADDGVNPPVPESVDLVIANAPPTVDITSPADGASVAAGTSLGLSAAVGDPGANDSLACTVDWGDGAPASSGVIAGGACSADHTYLAAGLRTITVTVTDDDGGSAIDTVTIDVSGTPNPPPDPDPGTYPSPAGGEGSAIALHGTIVNEPATDTLTQTWAYTPGAGTDAGMACAFGDVHALDTTISCTDDGTVRPDPDRRRRGQPAGLGVGRPRHRQRPADGRHHQPGRRRQNLRHPHRVGKTHRRRVERFAHMLDRVGRRHIVRRDRRGRSLQRQPPVCHPWTKDDQGDRHR